MTKQEFDNLRIGDPISSDDEHKVIVSDIDRRNGMIFIGKNWHNYTTIDKWIRQRNKRTQNNEQKYSQFRRKVRCITDDKVFSSVRECAEYYRIGACSIRNSAMFNEEVKKIGKRFEYLTEGYSNHN